MTTVLAQPDAAAPPSERSHAPEDLLTLPEDHHYELVDGQLVEEPPVGTRAVSAATELAAMLVNWSNERGVEEKKGVVLSECYYKCFPHQPNMARRPDVSFISRARLAPGQLPEGLMTVAPELAVEVVSPTDNIYDLDRKIDDYFRAEVRQVWVLNPDQRLLRIHRPSGDATERRGEGEIVGDDDVLPGFRCSLTEIFGAAAQQ